MQKGLRKKREESLLGAGQCWPCREKSSVRIPGMVCESCGNITGICTMGANESARDEDGCPWPRLGSLGSSSFYPMASGPMGSVGAAALPGCSAPLPIAFWL